MIISRVMTKNPIYVHPDASITETRSLMDREKVGHLPVLDHNNTLAGIVTKEDMIKASPSEATTLDMYEISYLLSKMRVQEIMVKKVITVDENEVVEEAARIMADKDIGCLPVMRGSLLVGIITDTDLFRVFVNAFGARHAGVRVTLSMGEHPGELARISGAIAERGGNIVSFVTSEGDDVAHRRGTIKVGELSKGELEAVMKSIPDVVVEDIRE
ncbi:MAG: CBS domain-containing protein [Spirochaetaceae bacterium]|jgi:acetoin utilization protein AcuB|nr:CBS domain-containing protein [Spirochaetaceae bacterium]